MFQYPFGFPDQSSSLWGIRAFRRWSPGIIPQCIGFGRPVVGSVFTHLQEIGAAAEEDFPGPSVSLSENDDFVEVAEDFVGQGV